MIKYAFPFFGEEGGSSLCCHCEPKSYSAKWCPELQLPGSGLKCIGKFPFSTLQAKLKALKAYYKLKNDY